MIRNLSFALLGAMLCTAILAPQARSQNITFNQADRLNPYYPYNMAKADLNKDGYPDLMFSLNSLNIYTLLSNGSGQYVDWTIPTAFCPSVPIGVGDFLRDGNQSILVGYPDAFNGPCGGTTNQGATFAEYSNNGSAIFNHYGTYTGEAVAGVVADFNGDKKLDYVALAYDTTDTTGTPGYNIQLYYGNGYGGFSKPFSLETLPSSAAPTGLGYNMAVGDFDGNGCPDVAWVEGTGGAAERQPLSTVLKVAYGDCKGGFAVTSQFTGNIYLNSLHVSDLNRDGVSDLVTTYDVDGAPGAGIQIFYGQKNRTLTQKVLVDNEASDPLEVADLNGDGYPDIAYFDYVNGASNPPTSSTLVIRQGDATQAFTIETTYPFGQNSANQILAGDFNRDGKQDLAVLYSGPTIPSTDKGFSFLYNTTTYSDGACIAPAGPGINICSPGATSTSAVNVLAAGNVDNPAVYMELWVDGNKIAGFGSTNELRTNLTLTSGKHTLGFFAIDAAGNKVTNSKVVTVQ